MRKKNQYWKLLLKTLVVVFLAFAMTLAIVLMIAAIKHSSLKKQEAQYLEPIGQMVEVNGHNIHVMHEGNPDSDTTLVFLHSNKVIDDCVVLQPLFKELQDYDLIYIDRSGYGLSDDYNADKDIESMLEETRTALASVTDKKSYVLVASKSAGVEAIHWANQYPDEVKAIIGLEMYLPDQYKELENDAYCGFGNKLLVGLVKIGAQRYAKDIYPQNSFSLYTEKQMTIRNAIVSNRFYTKGMYNEDKNVVKNGKAVLEEGWPEKTPMYLVYANPFMDPYLHEDDEILKLYNQVLEQGEEYDPVASYNDYYITYLADKTNVTVEELSAPERLINYNPVQLAKMISSYANSLE